MILQLKAKGVHTCIPIKQLDKTYIGEINAPEGKRYAILFHEVKNDKTTSTYNMGKLAAQIHKESDTMILKIRRPTISYEQLNFTTT